MPKKPTSKLPETHFAVWVTFPKSKRPGIKSAAGSLDMPMSDFARRAIEEAVRKVEAGQKPFPEKSD